MKTHNLIQGSLEWHTYRAQHFNASDAPAMMGCSPHKTRAQLLHELHTGLAQEVNAGAQRRFDDGHRFEALARPLAEQIIGEELFPVTASNERFSASFDGLTMLEDVAWEHKTLNDELRAAMPEGVDQDDAPELPLMYRVQMEHQLMVCGAAKTLFSASKWQGDELIEARHRWYFPDAELRAQIVAGWAQFAEDLAAYAPPVVVVEAVGRAPETLPALHIEVTGMVTASNIAEFKALALGAIKSVNRDLKTDQDFADNAKAIKWCADIEGRVKAAKEHALSQTASIDTLFRAMDEISAEARNVRLELERLDKARKEAVRGEIVAGGVASLREHVTTLNARLGKPYMPAIAADFAGAIKGGKRTVESLQNAVDTTLAKAKIDASAIADKIQTNLGTLRELAADHAFLFADTPQIVLKAPDDLTALVKTRIAEHQKAEAARIEAETARIRAEVEQQERARAEAEAARPAAVLAAPAAQQQPEVVPMAQEPEILKVATFEPESPAGPPTLRLGQITDRLGFALTAAFLQSLGFEPAGKDRAAVLYHEADFPRICATLVAHVQACALTIK